MSDNPKIQIDDDWKAQAEREKERLSGAAAPAPDKTAAAPAPASEAPAAAPKRDMPAASFSLMVEEYPPQILFAVGAFPPPARGKTRPDLDVARHYIDMLAVLLQKTQGNLSMDEQKLLEQ